MFEQGGDQGHATASECSLTSDGAESLHGQEWNQCEAATTTAFRSRLAKTYPLNTASVSSC